MDRVATRARSVAAASQLAKVDRTTGRRTSDAVYAELAGAIRDLRLEPGVELSEAELAAALNVSRTPVREAIARLAEQRLVQVIPQVGTSVARISLGEVRAAQFIRESLETAAYLRACRDGYSPDSTLEQALQEQRDAQAAGDFKRFFLADEKFHAALFASAGYGDAWQAMHQTKFHLDRVRRLVNQPEVVVELIAEHEQILSGFLNRDPAGVDIVATHSRRVLKYAPEQVATKPHFFDDSSR